MVLRGDFMAEKVRIEATKPITNDDLARVEEYKVQQAQKLAATAAKKARRRAIKEALDDVLAVTIGMEDVPDVLIQNLLEDRAMPLTALDAMAAAMVRKAMYGDVPAATFVRDTVGENPKQVIGVDGTPFDVNITVLNEGDGHDQGQPTL